MFAHWAMVILLGENRVLPRGCLRFVIVVFPDHTRLLFLYTVHRYEYEAFQQGKTFCYILGLALRDSKSCVKLCDYFRSNKVLQVKGNNANILSVHCQRLCYMPCSISIADYLFYSYLHLLQYYDPCPYFIVY